MLIRQTSALLIAAASAVKGLEQTSPFFLLASEPLKYDALTSKQIATAHHVEQRVLESLQDCAQTFYFVVSQPGLTAADLRDETSVPKIREHVAKGAVAEIAEVVGEVDAGRVAEKIGQHCGVEVEEAALGADWQQYKGRSAVIMLTGEELGVGETRARELAVHDAQLDRYISNVTNHHKAPYVVIYTSAPATTQHEDTPPYKMDEAYPEILHTDLKRHIETRQVRRADSDDNPQAGLPLFEKYQFLSPGIFMGLSVSLVLFLILYVGISAIAGLEVSYMAFSKEVGPQAQKGKQ